MIELLLQADRLLNMGMTDQADTIYKRVAEQDPQNAIAVVGLARCALAREDDHEAYRLAARALTIDPQNDMARRMEARLTEVLTLRGEAPGRPGAAATDPGAGTPTELRPLVTPAAIPAAPARPTTAAPTPTPTPTPTTAPAPARPATPAGTATTAPPVPTPATPAPATSATPPSSAAPTPTPTTATRPRSPLPSSATTTRSILGRLLGR